MEFDLIEFGTEEWIEKKLTEILVRARDEAETIYNLPDDVSMKDVDFDSYTYIEITSSRRGLWSLMKSTASKIQGIGVIDNKKLLFFPGSSAIGLKKKAFEHKAHEAALNVLLESGILGEIEIHYRD